MIVMLKGLAVAPDTVRVADTLFAYALPCTVAPPDGMVKLELVEAIVAVQPEGKESKNAEAFTVLPC